MNAKGQLSIQIFIATIVLFFMMYMFMQIYDPVTELLYPSLENQEHGATMILMLSLVPLILIFQIVIYPWMESKWNREGRG